MSPQQQAERLANRRGYRVSVTRCYDSDRRMIAAYDREGHVRHACDTWLAMAAWLQSAPPAELVMTEQEEEEFRRAIRQRQANG